MPLTQLVKVSQGLVNTAHSMLVVQCEGFQTLVKVNPLLLLFRCHHDAKN